ncbi:MAG: fimbrillin family protein [Bacteroidales bacterium]|nr:fimbrillin family protein [Bacteroidales bacterium]
MRLRYYILALALPLLFAACSRVEEMGVEEPDSRKVSFDVSVSRGDGSVKTKGSYDVGDAQLKMDPGIPFGLVGIDTDSHSLLVNNVSVAGSESGAYSTFLDNGLWDIPTPITFSAYYPYMSNIHYGSGYDTYSLTYTPQEVGAGPLVSKTVQRAVNQLNRIPLQFQHITNDIGYKVCDATEDPNLQGLIHLRKLTATGVAQAGVFENEVALSRGLWNRQGYYTDVVVFEGDARVGVGSEGEQFVGKDSLVLQKSASSRYYAIPDEILMGKQTVEVVYDIDGFNIGEESYPPMKGVTTRFNLYGLLPDNTFVYGKQYTFHLGLDLGTVYHAIAFSASVNDWGTKIYEDNEDF